MRTASVLVSRRQCLADMRIISVARGKQGQPLSYFSYLSDNIMTIDEEMKELSAKAAKASRKQEKCENNVQFPIVFLNQALPRWRLKIGKTVPRCLLECTRTSRLAIFSVQVGVCLSLELCFLPRRGAHLQKNEGLKLDCIEKSRKMKGRKIKKNKNQEI